jgi:hypothetical protein
MLPDLRTLEKLQAWTAVLAAVLFLLVVLKRRHA